MKSILKHTHIRSAARRGQRVPYACNGRFINTLHQTGDSQVAAQRADAPFRLAIIGSGPSGFYTAYRVQSKLPTARIDMYEALPVPFGLVRFGVAPDHPEVKFCINKFDEVARHPNFTYIGNTPIGSESLPFSSLLPNYNAILLSYGASKDKTLNLPGESTLSGIHSARAFVGWYNGLPEHRDLNPDLEGSDGRAVVIGQGNVALDVARILLTGVDELRKTDITEYALEALSKSKVKEVEVVGRRGPLQAAFTIKEVRELMTLPSVGFEPVPHSIIPQDTSALPRAKKRLMDTINKGTKSYPLEKNWKLSFFNSPTAFLSSPENSDQLSHIRFEKTAPAEGTNGDSVIRTGEHRDVSASLAFRSIGYKSEPISGMIEAGIPFDEKKGIVCNTFGRVARPTPDGDVQVPGMYTAGWVRRGPTGVIASTMMDAFDAGDNIVNDWLNGVEFMGKEGEVKMGWEAVKREHLGLGLKAVHWNDWDKIDKAEKERGAKIGKEREKFGTEQEMMAIV
ncbi:NADPH-adrenodoxin reductase [Orbilia blumenaviensis]|uniref:NADPH:adrenodoxin oxidoreductase, mitochondrial n=1 Tax=Orbilia blumenaviensis TaxID=1796055 RepID=A0AAV9UMK8_9PEZI